MDNLSGQWLADRITQMGVDANLHPFAIDQVNVISAQLHWDGGVIEAVPAYDCNYTDGEGLQGSMGELNSGADIGVIMSAAIGPTPASIRVARMSGAHKAIVVVRLIQCQHREPQSLMLTILPTLSAHPFCIYRIMPGPN
ncbi:MAG: hypothetical protein JKY98_04895 [Gammaproteobacteria bacterium]|nr:hypothetical protein [Gammaproteobacteria bacterium]